MVFTQEMAYLKKNGKYVINLDECRSIGTLFIALHLNGSNYFMVSVLSTFQRKF